MVLVSARPLLFPATLLLLLAFRAAQAHRRIPNGLKTDFFLSPDFPLEPGSVSNKFYYNLGFPKGHIAIKSFDAEVVDEKGSPVPLHETYLHHWICFVYRWSERIPMAFAEGSETVFQKIIDLPSGCYHVYTDIYASNNFTM